MSKGERKTNISKGDNKDKNDYTLEMLGLIWLQFKINYYKNNKNKKRKSQNVPLWKGNAENIRILCKVLLVD